VTSDDSTDIDRGVRRAAGRTWPAAQPLTEQGPVKAGVYANLLTFGYSPLVRNAGDPGYHKRSLTDSLTVPVVAG
jgi:hypothetical protein